MVCINQTIFYWKLLTSTSVIFWTVCYGMTDTSDVAVINSLYASLGMPVIPGWVPNGGDPCAEEWHGVFCVGTKINTILLRDLNLGGELGDHLGHFKSIAHIDFSNNHIGGAIPSNLPSTLMRLYLSNNQFSGSIPPTLSLLSQVYQLKFNNNHLTGEIPDVFQQLQRIVKLDLSGNNLTGHLPPSMRNLSHVHTLYLQNNQLTGTLDVLQDLPLYYLNIANNLFSGPIPGKPIPRRKPIIHKSIEYGLHLRW